jgi:P4 family phage/plasmid primase-like protien
VSGGRRRVGRASLQEVNMQTTALQLFDAGYRDLVSVVPPGAKLSEMSDIPDGSDPAKPDQRGKAPGKYDGNRGHWGGYAWRSFEPLRAHIELWQQAGANIGLHARQFPAIDIDCLDEAVTTELTRLAIDVLGPAPRRIGKAPKALLVYGTAQPFTRLRLHFFRPGQDKAKGNPLIEVLGDGQQYLVAGVHPGTMKPYQWDKPLHEFDPLDDLSLIDIEKAERFLDEAEAVLDLLGFECRREGRGRLAGENGTLQENLAAPSFEACQRAVAAIPNTTDEFPSRDAMNEMGYAIKASVGEAGLELFQEWASRWEDGANDPDYVAHEFERMVPPFRIGWEWLISKARAHGYSDAQDDFEAIEAPEGQGDDFDAIQAPPGASTPPPPTTPSGELAPAKYSDFATAQRFVKTFEGQFRYVEKLGGWLAYSGSTGTWALDTALKHEKAVQRICVSYAEAANIDSGLNAAQRRSIVMGLQKSGTVGAVLKVARSHTPFAGLGADDFDRDIMLLNTPAGMVDLRTGEVRPHAPEHLATKITEVAPAAGTPKKWLAFLEEALGGDLELIDYMQRMAGYWLTGSTKEQQLTFIWGPGGNGKGVFANTLADLMGGYATRTPSSTFAAARNEQHPEAMARLHGARLVMASEVQEGQAWNEEKVKTFTGGDKVTARAMYGSSFDFMPQGKLLFLGNHKPRIRSLDRAMKRRFHMVPMTVTPRAINLDLPEELKAEWPQILQWAIDGCAMWQQRGLKMPKVVLDATKAYFGEEDAFGAFLDECCDRSDEKGFTSSMAMWKAWEHWALATGEHPHSQKWLAQQITQREGIRSVTNYPVRGVKTAYMRGFTGVKLLLDEEFEAIEGSPPPQKTMKA